MKADIELTNIEFHAYHGCFDEEKIIGNTFIVNITVTTNIKQPSVSDNISDALNYQTLFNIVKAQMAITSNLLEHVAARIITAIEEEFGDKAEHITVTVSKHNPPLGGKLDKVSITVRK